MTDIFVQKVRTATGYALVPAHQNDVDAMKKLPMTPLRVKVTRPRNVQFHRKIFALLNLLYDWWEPTDENTPAYLKVRGITPEKSFTRFRRDLMILAGFYDATYRINDEVRVEAKSMSFSNMTEDEAAELFDKFLDIGVKKIAPQHSNDEVRAIIDQILEFES